MKHWIRHLKATRVGAALFAVSAEFGRQKITLNAAALSFYLFFSIIPFFTLMCSLLPYTGITADALSQALQRVTPFTIHTLIDSIVQSAYAARVSVFSVSCAVLLWSSAKLMKALLRALDAIYGLEGVRGSFTTTAFALLYTLGLIALLVALLFFYVKGHSLEEIAAITGSVKRFFGRWTALGSILCSAAPFTLLFALVYRFGPTGERSYLRQLPGAAFASVGIAAFTAGFSIYSSGGNVYNSFYGSLTAVALLLTWIYACCQIFLIGAVLNARRAARRTAPLM